MPTNPPRCRHLHTDGRQCGSPALRHEKLCFQHHAARLRPAYTPTLPDPEDLHAVSRGLAELLRLVARELIDDKGAKRLFAILTAAGTNLARIDRQRRATRELDLRAHALALAEARLHAQHPEASCSAQPSAYPSADPSACPFAAPSTCPSICLSVCHSRREWASLSNTEPATDPVTTVVHDPVLGPLAPAADPDNRASVPDSSAGCHPFATVPPSRRGDRSALNLRHEEPITDPIDDPQLGLIAPGPEPEPRPIPEPRPSPEPGPTPRPTPEDPYTGDGGCATTPTTPQPERPTRAREAELAAERDAEAREHFEFMREDRARSEERESLRRAARDVMYRLLTPEARQEEDERYAAEIAGFFGYTLEEISRLPPTPLLHPTPLPPGDPPTTRLEC